MAIQRSGQRWDAKQTRVQILSPPKGTRNYAAICCGGRWTWLTLVVESIDIMSVVYLDLGMRGQTFSPFARFWLFGPAILGFGPKLRWGTAPPPPQGPPLDLPLHLYEAIVAKDSKRVPDVRQDC